MSELPTGSRDFQLRNPHLFKSAPPITTIAEARKRIRQSSRPLLNKLETEWLKHLESNTANVHIFSQAIRLRIGNGIWYKPDFVVWTMADNYHGLFRVNAYEVKGQHAFRGGFENLKVAAHQYQAISWFLVWKDKETGRWREQSILP